MINQVSSGDLLLVAMVADRAIALPAADVASISELEKVTVVPGGPEWIVGIGTQRSRALTVLDSRGAIGLPEAEDSSQADARCIVYKHDGHLYALHCDAVLDVTIAASDAGPLPKGLGQAWMAVATGVVETSFGPALLIDLAALTAGPERVAA